MRDVPARLEAIWGSGDYTGDQRPMARVTVQKPQMKLRQFAFPTPTGVIPTPLTVTPDSVQSAPGDSTDEFADFLFSGEELPKELPNVKSVEWSRSLDQDIATCTIVFYNTRAMPLGTLAQREYDEQGFYTYNRGATAFSSRWGQSVNGWAGLLMPDNILRTYEGYGFDPTVGPERDPNLLQTGVWRIDSVNINTDGTLTATCRDLGSLLLDQIAFLPVVPPAFYPLRFSHVARSSGFHDPSLTVTRVQVDDYNSEAVLYGSESYGTEALSLSGHYAGVAIPDGLGGLRYVQTAAIDLSRQVEIDLTISTTDPDDENAPHRVRIEGAGWRLAGTTDGFQTLFEDTPVDAVLHLSDSFYVPMFSAATSDLTNRQQLGSVRYGTIDSDVDGAPVSPFAGRVGGTASVNGATVEMTSVAPHQTGIYVGPSSQATRYRFIVGLGGGTGGEGIALAFLREGAPTAGTGDENLGLGGLEFLAFTLTTAGVPGSTTFPVTFAASTNGLRAGGSATADLPVDGHYPSQAFDYTTGDYWLSRGNRTVTGSRVYEWIEGTCDIAAMAGVIVDPVNAGYYCYVSVHNGQDWVSADGQGTVPYSSAGDPIDRQAAIPYVASSALDSGERQYRIALTQVVRNVKRIRLTFTHASYFPPPEDPNDRGLFRIGISALRAFGYRPGRPTPLLPPAKKQAPTSAKLDVLIQDTFGRADAATLGQPPYPAQRGGASIKIEVPNTTAGAVGTLSMTYSNVSGDVQTLSLYQNDAFLHTVTFPALATDTTWGTHVENVLPAAGSNTFMLKFDGQDRAHGILIDKLVYADQDHIKTVEAEDATLNDGAVIAKTRLGYSGKGYVDGFVEANRGGGYPYYLSDYAGWNVLAKDSDKEYWQIRDNKAVRAHRGHHDGTRESRVWAIYPYNHRQQIVEAVTAVYGPQDGTASVQSWNLGVRFGIDATGGRYAQGIVVEFGRFDKVDIFLVEDDVYTLVASQPYPAGSDILGMRIRVDVTDSRVQTWFNVDGTREWGTPLLEVTDPRFSNHKFGVGCGFASDTYQSAYASFQVRSLLFSALSDAFEAKAARTSSDDVLKLDSFVAPADSGQDWVSVTGISPIGHNGAYLRRQDGMFRYALNTAGDPGGSAHMVAYDVGPSMSGVTRLRNRNGSGDTHWHLFLRVNHPEHGNVVDSFIRVTFYANGTFNVASQTTAPMTIKDAWDTPLIPDNPTGGIERAIGTGTFFAPGGAHDGPFVQFWLSEDHLVLAVDNVTVYDQRSPLLWNTHLGAGFGLGVDDQWGAFDDVEVYAAGDTFATTLPYSLREFDHYSPGFIEPGAGFKPGSYEDFTDIIKLVCAWAGFHWPSDGYLKYSDATVVPVRPDHDDVVLGLDGVGRVWGDFETTGTGGQVDLDSSNFDKKTLMDVISYIRDIIGYLFYIDETGAVVWRSPNIFTVGNMRGTTSTAPGRTDEVPVIDESLTLIQLGAALSNTNLRERVFVSNTDGSAAAAAAGWNPNPVGLRRVAGWTDEHFASKEECLQMAEMITIRQLFTYRQDTLRIPGYPKLQIDDQIRIYERTTSEGFYHYLKGISSNNDLETGEWFYDLQTHWLGVDPFTSWAFDKDELSAATQEYIEAVISSQVTNRWYENPRNAGSRNLPYYSVVVEGGSYAASGWATLLRNDLIAQMPGNVALQSVATPGISTVEMLGRAPYLVDPLLALRTTDYNLLVAMEISQHLANGATAADALSTYRSYITGRKGQHWIVLAVTVPYRRDYSWTEQQAQSFETARQAVNAELRAHAAEYADGLIDADFVLGSAPANFSGPALSPAGNQLLAAAAASVIRIVAPVEG